MFRRLVVLPILQTIEQIVAVEWWPLPAAREMRLVHNFAAAVIHLNAVASFRTILQRTKLASVPQPVRLERVLKIYLLLTRPVVPFYMNSTCPANTVFVDNSFNYTLVLKDGFGSICAGKIAAVE